MTDQKVLLEVRELSAVFNGFKALTRVSLKIYEGELRVIIGPNGAGKTTFMDLVTGKTTPTSGKVLFDGTDITGKSASEIARKCRIGRKFQGPNVFDNMTVKENIEIAMEGFTGLESCLFFRSSPKFSRRVGEILTSIDLYDYMHFMASDLSHGQRQWLEIGMVFAQNPRLIILDEPTAGMTVDETYKTGEMIKKLKGDHTLIVVEHDMDFVRQVAEYVTVFNYGQLLAEGPLEQVQQDPEVIAVYLKED
ncbi:MAG TPA: urea ABC transporter ATP-binding protein UrtD [Anaerovoracaceae bacterium]|nr:urea ABC transporter ATP-binding protein UrtD [Anaerovoracaceae bacterium]